jgi:hypothetical protein
VARLEGKTLFLTIDSTKTIDSNNANGAIRIDGLRDNADDAIRIDQLIKVEDVGVETPGESTSFNNFGDQVVSLDAEGNQSKKFGEAGSKETNFGDSDNQGSSFSHADKHSDPGLSSSVQTSQISPANLRKCLFIKFQSDMNSLHTTFRVSGWNLYAPKYKDSKSLKTH